MTPAHDRPMSPYTNRRGSSGPEHDHVCLCFGGRSAAGSWAAETAANAWGQACVEFL